MGPAGAALEEISSSSNECLYATFVYDVKTAVAVLKSARLKLELSLEKLQLQSCPVFKNKHATLKIGSLY